MLSDAQRDKLGRIARDATSKPAPMQDTLKTETPCCGRLMRVPFYLFATHICRRTCRKCGVKYQLKVTPALRGHIHITDWKRL